MNFFQQLILGYRNYVAGTKFLIQHKLYWFILIPILIFIGIYYLGFYFEALEYSVLHDLEDQGADIKSINGLIWMTLKMILLDSLYIIFTKFTLYIVVMLLSPLMAILSEKIEEIITGNVYPFNFLQLMKDIRRGIRIALRNIFWEYFFFVIILGVGVFVGGTAKSIIIFTIPIVIGFYFYGFSFLDYINERRRLNIEQSVYFVSKHKGLAISIGSIYSIFFLSFFYVYRGFDSFATDTATQLFWGSILVITFLLAATAPILAITSATLSMHELVDLGKNEHAIKKEILGKENQNQIEESPADTEETSEEEKDKNESEEP